MLVLKTRPTQTQQFVSIKEHAELQDQRSLTDPTLLTMDISMDTDNMSSSTSLETLIT